MEEFTIKFLMVNPLRQFGSWYLEDRRKAIIEAEKLNSIAIKLIKSFGQNPSPTPDTIIDLIMKSPNHQNYAERIPDTIMIMFAGHDTTSYTLWHSHCWNSYWN